MNDNFKNICYMQGISDFMNFHDKCPKNWLGREEEREWKRGHNYARSYII